MNKTRDYMAVNHMTSHMIKLSHVRFYHEIMVCLCVSWNDETSEEKRRVQYKFDTLFNSFACSQVCSRPPWSTLITLISPVSLASRNALIVYAKKNFAQYMLHLKETETPISENRRNHEITLDTRQKRALRF